MARPRRVKLPNATAGEHVPGGKRPRGVDLSELAKLKDEEQAIRAARKQERANSAVIKLRVRPAVYRDLLALSKEFDREINAQATECFELGVRFYKNTETPHGTVRPLNMLPELRHGNTMMGEPPTDVHHSSEPRPQGQRRYGTDADPEAATGWLPGAGLPITRERPFRQVVVQPEPDPTFETQDEIPEPEHAPDEVVEEAYVESDGFEVEV